MAYKICRSKFYDNITKLRRGTRTCDFARFLCVKWCNITQIVIKMYTVTPKVATKNRQQHVVSMKSRKKMKWNHDKYSVQK